MFWYFPALTNKKTELSGNCYLPQFTQEVEVARLDAESVDSQGHVLNYYAKLSPQVIVIRPETLDDLPMGRRYF